MQRPGFKESLVIRQFKPELNHEAKTSKELIPEPTARSAVPGVSLGRGLLISY